MKVLMLTGGSRGDVQPFIALGCALKTSGHEVVIAGPAAFAAVAGSYKINYEVIYDVDHDSYKGPLANIAVRLSRNGNPLFFLQQASAHRRHFHKTLNDIASIDYVDCDVVLHNHMAPGNEVAEQIGVPSVLVATSPVYAPTDAFPNPWLTFSRLPVPKIINRASYLGTNFLCRYNLGNTKKWRREKMGLAPRSGHRNLLRLPDGQPATILQPNSLHFLPPSTCYPDWAHTTGFWYLPTAPGWVPPFELVEFLDAGAPPVYIGFGSLLQADGDPDRTARISAEAAKLAGVRAIIFSGLKNHVHKDDDEILHLSTPVPFEWLFPKMAAVVHHGGTGTIGVALASGRPQIVCPAVCEQPFNAKRAHELQISPSSLPLYRVTPHRLALAITEAVTSKTMEDRAKEVGNLTRSEDGVTRAVKILENLV